MGKKVQARINKNGKGKGERKIKRLGRRLCLAINKRSTRRTDGVVCPTDGGHPAQNPQQKLEDEIYQKQQTNFQRYLQPHGFHWWWNEQAIEVNLRLNHWPLEPLQQGIMPSDATLLNGDWEPSAICRSKSCCQGLRSHIPQGVGAILVGSCNCFKECRGIKVKGWQSHSW